MAGKTVVNQMQLGDSSTATNNFVLQTNVDGTAVLARGNQGATTQDILTIDANGVMNTPNWNVSLDTTFVNGGALTQAHSMITLPIDIKVFAICVTAEIGYVTDDAVDITGSQNDSNFGSTTSLDSTNITLSIGSSGLLAVPKTGGVVSSLSPSNWKIRFYWR